VLIKKLNKTMTKRKLDKTNWKGEIKDGKLEGFNWTVITSWLQNYDDCKITMTLTRIRSIRSDKQNRYYWANIHGIAKQTGNPPELLHELFKKRYLAKGTHEVMDEEVITYKSTTRLSIGEFVEYLLHIEQDTGIKLLDPEQYYDDITELISEGRKK